MQKLRQRKEVKRSLMIFLNFSKIENTKSTEAENFMIDPYQSIKRLNNNPEIKDPYIEYNTFIPSSAPV